ncbi:hypothetical protein [Myxococcus stipitatus]|uniref:hypothetical protein n=1 Tax=Myxococcus stipitatus TaxID=83455 RepID=UPI0030D582E9
MFTLRTLLSAALTLGLLLGTSSAEARFGKRSRPSQSDSPRDDDKDTHEATPVGHEDSDDDDDERERRRRRRRHVTSDGVADFGFLTFIFTSGNHRLRVADEPRYRGEVRQERHAAPLSFRVGFQAGPIQQSGGGAGDLFMGIEGQRFGVDARFTGIAVDADDGSNEVDSISLWEAHLTWALVSQERIRLRAEAGISGARAPDISFVGLSLGMSMEACLVGPLDFEARVQATPFPYRQVDASAALALHLGAVVLRGGYRGMLLDDAGHVDGIAHRDTFHGPFAGLGLSF